MSSRRKSGHGSCCFRCGRRIRALLRVAPQTSRGEPPFFVRQIKSFNVSAATPWSSFLGSLCASHSICQLASGSTSSKTFGCPASTGSCLRRLQYVRLLVFFFSDPERFIGMDPKRRMATSRPGSAVSYGRNEHLASIYAASPGPEPSLTGNQTLFTHSEAMDRFNVSVPRNISILLTNSLRLST